MGPLPHPPSMSPLRVCVLAWPQAPAAQRLFVWRRAGTGTLAHTHFFSFNSFCLFQRSLPRGVTGGGKLLCAAAPTTQPSEWRGALPCLPEILGSGCLHEGAATQLGVLSTHGCPEHCGAAGRGGWAGAGATITQVPATGTLSCPGSGAETKATPCKVKIKGSLLVSALILMKPLADLHTDIL